MGRSSRDPTDQIIGPHRTPRDETQPTPAPQKGGCGRFPQFSLAGFERDPRDRHNRNRPAGEAGRFWGYYREERYVSLYMWIRGREVSPVCVECVAVGSSEAIYRRGVQPKSLCRCSLIGFLLRILEQRTNVCATCL